MPTPVSVPADPRVLGLGMGGFPFPQAVRPPAREDCAADFVLSLAGPHVVPGTLGAAELLGQAHVNGHLGEMTAEPESMPMLMPMLMEGVSLSPRAFLLREMQQEQEDLAAEFALAHALSDREREREREEDQQDEEEAEEVGRRMQQEAEGLP